MKNHKSLVAVALAMFIMLALIATAAQAATEETSNSGELHAGLNGVGFIATQTPCATVPDRPSLESPKNAAALIALRVTLSWKTTRCAQWYQVTVRQNSTTGKSIMTKVWTTNTKVQTPKLAQGYTYYWIVQACDYPSRCAASVWRSFSIEPD